MRVQVSDWNHIATSLKVSTKSNRNGGAIASLPSNGNVLPFALSLVRQSRTLLRSSKRRKIDHLVNQGNPFLVITTSHEISVLKKRLIMEPINEVNFVESTALRYSSRPGKKSSFLTECSSPKSNRLPQISAAMDSGNSRMYAMQSDNSTIVSWMVDSDGPHDSKASRISLPEPAMCMHVASIGKGIVYGTLKGNRIYVVSWSPEGTAMKCYTSTIDNSSPKQGRQICTAISTIETEISHDDPTIEKSQETKIDLLLTQCYAMRHGFLLQRYTVSICNGQITLGHIGTKNLKLLEPKAANCVIDETQILHECDGKSLFLAFQEVTTKEIINGKRLQTETRRSKACLVNLSSTELSFLPLEFPESIRHIGFLYHNFLAVGSMDKILIYDIQHGILFKSIDVSPLISSSNDWLMTTDIDSGHLFLVSIQNNIVRVSFQSLELFDTKSRAISLTLADGLRSYTPMKQFKETSEDLSETKNLLTFVSHATLSEVINCNDQSEASYHLIQHSLSALNACVENAFDSKSGRKPANFLLDAYELSLSKVLPASAFSPNVSEQGATTNAACNIISNRGETPCHTPQEFIDGALKIILSVLLSPKNQNYGDGINMMIARLDARLILYKLVRSGKISIRRHFRASSEENMDDFLLSVLRSMKLTNKRGCRVVSPVDLIHEMLSNCSDLSEHHLVTMIHYTICRALPHDIAENFLAWKRFGPDHSYSTLSKQYFQAYSEEKRIRFQNPQDGRAKVKTLNQTLDALSAKLIKAGSLFTVQRILGYSKVNSSLLRTAFVDGLRQSGEEKILADILLTSLNAPCRQELSVAAIQWITILFDAFTGILSDLDSRKQRTLSHLNSSILVTSQITSLLSSLEVAKGFQARSVMEVSNERAESKTVPPQNMFGYCIEELIF